MQTEQQIQDAADDHYTSRFGEIARLLRLAETAHQLDHYEWSEEITERLREMPLDVSLLEIHVRTETMLWEILLGTGGPADRVRVETDFAGEIQDATYQHQDWFTPWTTAHNQDGDVVAAFAGVFYFLPLGDWVAANNPAWSDQ